MDAPLYGTYKHDRAIKVKTDLIVEKRGGFTAVCEEGRHKPPQYTL
jgi:hypothetical protein